MAKNPNKNPMRTFYRKPTKAATKAEEAKQNGRILRYRAKVMKEAKAKMAKKMKAEKAAMAKFLKGTPYRARTTSKRQPVLVTAAAARKANRATPAGRARVKKANNFLDGLFEELLG